MMAKMALVAIDGRDFALPVDRIRHILAEVKTYPLVCLRSGFSGVFLFNDDIIPLLQPSLLTTGLDRDRTLPYTIICQSDYGEVGLSIDQTVRIVDAREGRLTPAPPDIEPAMTTQLFVREGESYPLLDIDTLLAQLPYQ